MNRKIKDKVERLLVYPGQLSGVTGNGNPSSYKNVCARGILIDILMENNFELGKLVEMRQSWEQKDSPISFSDGSKSHWYFMKNYKVEFLQKLTDELKNIVR